MRTPDFVTCGGLITRNHDELQVKLSKVKANYGNRCQGAEAPVPYIQEGHVLLHFSSVVAGMGTGGGLVKLKFLATTSWISQST